MYLKGEEARETPRTIESGIKMEFLLNSSPSHPSIELDLPEVEKNHCLCYLFVYKHVSIPSQRDTHAEMLRTKKKWSIVGPDPKKLPMGMDKWGSSKKWQKSEQCRNCISQK